MPRKKKKTSKAKKTVKDLNQTDGMVREANTEPTTMEQVWGDEGSYQYKTLDVKTYASVLSDMSKMDLKHEAVRVGLLPIDNVQQLRSRLIREFEAHVISYNRPKTNSRLNPPANEVARKILSEGK